MTASIVASWLATSVRLVLRQFNSLVCLCSLSPVRPQGPLLADSSLSRPSATDPLQSFKLFRTS